MIRIDPQEPDDPSWYAWKRRARKARRELIADVEAGMPPRINAGLYKERKETILEFFHGKCAYCEVDIRVSQPGDVEHFRPKLGVAREPEELQDEASHLGYYWLAYYWRNLLPSCAVCNRPSSSKGQKLGKRNRFPVAGGRARKPYHDLREAPLLINPLLEDPAEHITFDQDGYAVGLSPRGVKTIEVLALNREALVKARKTVYLHVRSLIPELTSAMAQGNIAFQKELERELDDIDMGRAPFSAIARLPLRAMRRALAQSVLRHRASGPTQRPGG